MRTHRVHLALLALAVLAVYGQTLGFGRLSWDDHIYVGRSPDAIRPLCRPVVRKAFSLQETRQGPFYGYRPLHILSYHLDRTLWGGRDAGYRFGNLILHLACVWLVYRLVRRLFDAPRTALFGALLFAVFPYHVEAVAWLTERKGLLACLGMLAAADLDLSYRQSGRVRCLVGAWAAYAASLLSKSMWVTWPVLAAALAMLSVRRGPRAVGVRGWAATALPGYALLAAGGVWVQVYLGNAANVAALGHTPVARLAYVLATWGHYLLAFVRPLDTRPVNEWAWHWPELGRPPAWALAASAAALLAWAGAAAWVWRQRGWRWPAVAEVWFLVSLAPVANLVPMLYPHGDRFLYGPSLAVLVPAGAGLAWLHARGKALRLGAAALIVALAAISALTAYRWRSDVALWDYAYEQDPHSQAVNYHLGVTLAYQYGELDRAVPLLERAARPAPGRRFNPGAATRALAALARIHEARDAPPGRLRELLGKHRRAPPHASAP